MFMQTRANADTAAEAWPLPHLAHVPPAPAVLPSLYRRTFGSVNHEVVPAGSGQLQTIRPIQGCFYRFNLVQPPTSTAAGGQSQPGSPGQLVITELDPTQASHGELALELLDPGPQEACAGWGQELPLRLRQLYSHWLDR